MGLFDLPDSDPLHLAALNPKHSDLFATSDEMKPVRIKGHGHVGSRGDGFTGRMGVKDPRDLPTLALGVSHRTEMLVGVNGETDRRRVGVGQRVDEADCSFLGGNQPSAFVREAVVGMGHDRQPDWLGN